MRDKKGVGKCCVCGEYKKLSYEHVPPEKAFNSNKAYMYEAGEIAKKGGKEYYPWEFSKDKSLKSVQKQRGIGWYTLCGKCNNNTGAFYGNDFVYFASEGYRNISRIGLDAMIPNEKYGFEFRKIKPLSIAKQVLTMFCSINSPSFLDQNAGIRKLLLNKLNQGIDKNKYALGMYIPKGNLLKYIGFASIIDFSAEGKKITMMSEMTTIPIAFTLELNPKKQIGVRPTDITHWLTDFKYDQIVNMRLEIPALASNTYFPNDFRTKEEIIKNHEQD